MVCPGTGCADVVLRDGGYRGALALAMTGLRLCVTTLELRGSLLMVRVAAVGAMCK